MHDCDGGILRCAAFRRYARHEHRGTGRPISRVRACHRRYLRRRPPGSANPGSARPSQSELATSWVIGHQFPRALNHSRHPDGSWHGNVIDPKCTRISLSGGIFVLRFSAAGPHDRRRTASADAAARRTSRRTGQDRVPSTAMNIDVDTRKLCKNAQISDLFRNNPSIYTRFAALVFSNTSSVSRSGMAQAARTRTPMIIPARAAMTVTFRTDPLMYLSSSFLIKLPDRQALAWHLQYIVIWINFNPGLP
ncbi:hypothetical protein J3R73_004406 [Labrys monachus]|uniref:Uncharacterized protein n=1 Tax=Labrys monachus TaxID=217067 RepID=A0ABU0FJ23_9HYPH|nr:hypothetical protein [Labrys monachus]